MLIIMSAVIGFAAIVGSLQLIGQRVSPFIPGEMPLLGKLHRERERLGLPWFGKYRTALVAAASAAMRDADSPWNQAGSR